MPRLARLALSAMLVLGPSALAQNTHSVLGVPVVKATPGTKPHKPVHSAKPTSKGKPLTKPAPAPAATPAPPKPPTPPTAEPPAKLAPEKPDPTKGSSTGLKLPRWVAYRSDEVNLRSGPGMQYPIDWQYHRRDLPVRVLREFEVWRLIETQDGTKGWVHQATLTGRRGFLVVDPERVLRASADDAAAPVARLQPGVVGRLRACEAAKPWCEVQVGDYRGWLRRSEIWGVDPDEPVS